MLVGIFCAVYELWFKQVLHEVDWLRNTFAASVIDEDLMLRVVRVLQRIVEILKVTFTLLPSPDLAALPT